MYIVSEQTNIFPKFFSRAQTWNFSIFRLITNSWEICCWRLWRRSCFWLSLQDPFFFSQFSPFQALKMNKQKENVCSSTRNIRAFEAFHSLRKTFLVFVLRRDIDELKKEIQFHDKTWNSRESNKTRIKTRWSAMRQQNVLFHLLCLVNSLPCHDTINFELKLILSSSCLERVKINWNLAWDLSMKFYFIGYWMWCTS